MKSKETIRKTMLAKRQHFTAEEFSDKDHNLLKHLLECDELREVDELLAYASRPNEANTLEYLGYMLGQINGVWVPKTEANNSLRWLKLKAMDELRPGAFGIPEPMAREESGVQHPADAPVVVPMLAFSNSGHRVGYGGGYFDRFLVNHKGVKIGLAYEWQHIDVLPTESHDIAMDIIITEASVRYID